MKEKIMHLKVAYEWKSVRNVHHSINDLCGRLGFDLNEVDAIAMTARELLENAVKYGKSLPHCRDIDFQVNKEGEKTLEISITNGIASENQIGTLLEHLKRINSAQDTEKLYIERIQELMNNPDWSSGQLGLYRIAYEGAFLLDYAYADDLITVIARRSLWVNSFLQVESAGGNVMTDFEDGELKIRFNEKLQHRNGVSIAE